MFMSFVSLLRDVLHLLVILNVLLARVLQGRMQSRGCHSCPLHRHINQNLKIAGNETARQLQLQTMTCTFGAA